MSSLHATEAFDESAFEHIAIRDTLTQNEPSLLRESQAVRLRSCAALTSSNAARIESLVSAEEQHLVEVAIEATFEAHAQQFSVSGGPVAPDVFSYATTLSAGTSNPNDNEGWRAESGHD
eukprot:CAMPEP_0176454306 /NCGR_PEP_ID=MMETSP0127-20121128/29880_1 /TAXON_ID=938130 /ORGANISM="Platyophrya macrostoma, Strain WH" /LENGTH=119 /DNA_ID=CAMNT_0017843581 /DNA_START=18 /DNA_END=374 /DNA_ORIENTATION=+